MTIEEQWLSLEAEGGGANEWRLRLTRPKKGNPLFVAVEGTRRALLLRVPAETIPPRHKWPTCGGLEVFVVVLTGHMHLGVALRECRFKDVFSALAEDLARRIEESDNNPKEAISVLFGRLVRWQRFLAVSAEGLGPEAQRGLWGELYFLLHCLIPSIGPAAVDGWKGPHGANQDFQFPNAWIEVKTTLAKQPQAVRITSERQLDDSHGPSLFLNVLILEVQNGSGTTLPEMVEGIRRSLEGNPAAQEAFEDLLLSAGYVDVHSPRYCENGYAVRSDEVFRIGPGFPRIVENDLPEGVGDASYQLSLAACSSFSTPHIVLEKVLRQIISSVSSQS